MNMNNHHNPNNDEHSLRLDGMYLINTQFNKEMRDRYDVMKREVAEFGARLGFDTFTPQEAITVLINMVIQSEETKLGQMMTLLTNTVSKESMIIILGSTLATLCGNSPYSVPRNPN